MVRPPITNPDPGIFRGPVRTFRAGPRRTAPDCPGNFTTRGSSPPGPRPTMLGGPWWAEGDTTSPVDAAVRVTADGSSWTIQADATSATVTRDTEAEVAAEPCRLAFATSSLADSRVILDQPPHASPGANPFATIRSTAVLTVVPPRADRQQGSG